MNYDDKDRMVTNAITAAIACAGVAVCLLLGGVFVAEDSRTKEHAASIGVDLTDPNWKDIYNKANELRIERAAEHLTPATICAPTATRGDA